MHRHHIPDADKGALNAALEKIDANPYSDYERFFEACANNLDLLPDGFVEICQTILAERIAEGEYAHIITNCPIDKDLPVFDQDGDPVRDKYEKKKTFVGEALLETFAQLTETPLLGYITRNNGDMFHDVYAFSKYSGTQTQKSDGELFFHNDRTAHPVRADFLNLLGMRCPEENLVYTGYVDGRALTALLSDEHQALLRQPVFVTPFDDYSRDSNAAQTVSDPHVILENEHSFRYYETRTTTGPDAPVEAKDALLALKDALLIAQRDRVALRAGDLLSMPNQDGLHNRDLVEIRNSHSAKKRWLLKTYNFRDAATRAKFAGTFVEGRPGLVRD